MARKQKKYHYIYKTTCNVNGNYYIGMHSTDNLDDGYIGSGKRLWFSINYHGKENHTKEILEFCKNRKELKNREKEIIDKKLLSEELCMNLKIGGDGGFINEKHKKKFIEASKKSLKIAQKNGVEKQKKLRKENTEWVEFVKKKIIKGLKKSNFDHKTFLNKNHTEETKKKIGYKNSVNQEGKKNSQFGTCWVTRDGINKKIKKEEINQYLEIGWVKGRVI